MSENIFVNENINNYITQPNFYKDSSGALNSVDLSLQSFNFNGSIPTITASVGVSEIPIGSYIVDDDNNIYPIVSIDFDSPDIDESYYLNYLKDNEIITLIYSSSAASVSITYEDWENKILGTSGWLITKEGNAIFSNVAVRGDLEATTLDVGGTDGIIYNGTTVTIGSSVVINAPVTVNALQVGASPTLLKIANDVNASNDGIYINEYNYWYSDGQFGVGGSAGSAKWNGSTLSLTGNINATSGSFSGALTASVGKIGGFTLNNDALLATNIILSSSGGLRLGTNNQFSVTQGGFLTASTASIVGDSIINGTNIGNGGGNIASNMRVGLNALANNTTGNNNIAIGDQSLYSNTLGTFNIALGNQTLFNNASGDYNIAIGYAALQTASNTNSNYSIAIGYNALRYNDYSNGDIAIGSNSMLNSSNNTGANVAIGDSALFYTKGANNIAIGQQALYSSSGVTDSSNIALGTRALRNFSSGINNIAIGVDAATSIKNGSNNIAIGTLSLTSASGSSHNMFMGYSSGSGLLIGQGNVGFGYSALDSLQDGDYNISIGYNSGISLVTGNRNVYIGWNSSETNESDTVYIGTTTQLKLKIDSSQSASFYNNLSVNGSIFGRSSSAIISSSADISSSAFISSSAIFSSSAGSANISLDSVRLNNQLPSYYLDTSSTAQIKSGDLNINGDLTVDNNTLYVDSTNNFVGIGITTPSQKLTVNGTASMTRLAVGSTASFLNDVLIYSNNPATFYDSSGRISGQILGVDTPYLAIRSGSSTTDTNAQIRFTRQGTTSTQISEFRVYSGATYFSGSVGIATTTPASALHVTGGARVTANLSVGGDIIPTGDIYTTNFQVLTTACPAYVVSNVKYKITGNKVEFLGIIGKPGATILNGDNVAVVPSAIRPNSTVRLPVALTASPYIGHIRIVNSSGLLDLQFPGTTTSTASVHLDGVSYYLNN